jgi:hypothetical protein
MGNIVRFRPDLCEETRLLLPWYLVGRLEGAEQAKLEAHLKVCRACQAELRAEEALGAEIARLPPGVEEGWADMVRRVRSETSAGGLAGSARERLTRVAPWFGWAAAGVLAVVLVAGVGPRPQPAPPPAPYRALSDAPARNPGNVIVVIRPDATARAIRQALEASGATIVDGPTSAGAYVLRVTPDRRERALETLRASGVVRLAQPLDGGASP